MQTAILVPEPQVEEGCKEDGDCPSREACFAGDCKNPCTEITPCAEHADCKVYDTLPRRTMTCTCQLGFTGKGDVHCDKISKTLESPNCFSTCHTLMWNFLFAIAAPIESGCTSDSECPANQACQNRKCINPCSIENPCAKLATCIASNHRATCQCPSGMTGDPYVTCSLSKYLELCWTGTHAE
jgi:hypothetical protein